MTKTVFQILDLRCRGMMGTLELNTSVRLCDKISLILHVYDKGYNLEW
jgi:hypothetical protein